MKKNGGRQQQAHHVDRERYPGFTVSLPKWLHFVLTKVQRYKANDKNLKIIHDFIQSLNYEYIQKLIKKNQEE